MMQGNPVKVVVGSLIGFSVLFFAFAGLANPGSRVKKPQVNSANTFSLQAGRQWKLASLGTQAYNHHRGRRRPFVQFNLTDSIAYGFSGCNSFHCKLSIDQSGSIRFSDIQNTLIACLDENIEEAFVFGLQNTRKAKMVENELWLLDVSEKPLLKFQVGDSQ